MPKLQTNIESKNDGRFNPYVAKSISKSLLSPCRRVGLPRKRKTPNNSYLSETSLDTSSNKDSINTTPVSSNTISQKSSDQPYVAKSISKSLLTPCPRVGLPRKRKTPDSSNLKLSETSLDNSSNKDNLNATSVSSKAISQKSSDQLYVAKSLSKSLLTPCPRVGLPKKRKTSNSSNLSLSETSLDKPFSNKDNLNTTPVSSKTISQKSSDEQIASSNSNKLSGKLKKKTSRLDSEDDDDIPLVSLKKAKENLNENILTDPNSTTNLDINTEKITKVEDTNKDKSKHVKKENVLKEVQNKETKQQIASSNSNILSGKLKKKTYILDSEDDDMPLVSVKEAKENLNIKTITDTNSTTVNLGNNKKNTNVESTKDNKKLLKEVHNKEANNTKDNDKIENKSNVVNKNPDDLKENTPQSSICVNKTTENHKNNILDSKEFKVFERIQAPDDTSLLDHAYVKLKKKNTKLKRNLSMKKTSSEEYTQKNSIFHTNSPKTECIVYLEKICEKKDTPIVSPKEVDKLEKQVGEKRKLVEDLKRVEIYKNLHNVKELKELTLTWKKGCISALNDLLPHLQAHAEIDMQTLLNNLRVPKELITLSQDGDLI